MKRLVLGFAIVAVGCGKKKVDETVVGKDGAAAASALDAGPAVGDEDLPDEANVRAGKRTGLESADALPEVATEPLLRALLAGQVPWTRFVDPAVGVVVMRSLPAGETRPAVAEVVRQCGPALANAFAEYSEAAGQALAAPGMLYDVACDNVGFAVAIPGVVSSAVCSVSSPSDGGLDLDVVFVRDPARGLRITGLGTSDATATDDALLDQFDDEMGRYGAHCP